MSVPFDQFETIRVGNDGRACSKERSGRAYGMGSTEAGSLTIAEVLKRLAAVLVTPR